MEWANGRLQTSYSVADAKGLPSEISSSTWDKRKKLLQDGLKGHHCHEWIEVSGGKHNN